MQLADFDYPLPDELIAQHPLSSRSASRLLHVASGAQHPIADRQIVDLPGLLKAGDLLVFNDTRVIPARVFGTKPSGGQVEILLERVLDTRRILAQVRASKSLRPDVPVLLPGNAEARLAGRLDDLFKLELSVDALEFFQQYGSLPLPPYIERSPEAADAERYQTVFARELGAVAAPTAGLHFDAALLDRCAAAGIQTAQLTLHVGAGTFQPVRVADVATHRMHAERIHVDESLCDRIAAAKAAGGRVVAIGTTVVRALETAAQDGVLRPFDGDTRIFIYPGYRFRVIDALLTNFHLPQSTLLMLVCAFGGYERVMAAYSHAVAQRYRFFSYGDAMLIEPSPSASNP